jgi:hypothetical protein
VGVERTLSQSRIDGQPAGGTAGAYPDEPLHQGFQWEEKQSVLGELIHQENPHVICLNETKLTIPVYIDNYWSNQTVL